MESSNGSLIEILLNGCRVCSKPDKYMNLFYNINKELLRNLNVLLQSEIAETDANGSKWLCRDCAEQIEIFIKFRKTYEEASSKFSALVQAVSDVKETEEEVNYEVEALDDAAEDVLSADDCVTLEPRKEFSCEICDKHYRYLNSLARHVKIAHDQIRHTCSICSLDFTQKTSLLEHMRNIHKESMNIDEVFICEVCNRSFNTSKILQQHKKQHSLTKVEKKTPNKSTPAKTKYRKQCTTCGLFFKHIEEHKLSHQTENNYRCSHPDCNKTFKFKTSLEVHLRIHNNDRRFVCTTCHKKFRVSHHLKEHQSTHATEKNYICNVLACSKKFSSKLNLYKHSKLHLSKDKK